MGDVVLVHRTDDATGYAIQAAQATSRSPVTRAGRLCSHAAIYVGDGMIVDTTVGVGVTARSVWRYCQTRALQLRRLGGDALTPEEREAIAVTAREHVGEPYSVLEAITSKLWPRTRPVPQALYCSTLVGLVITEATGVDLGSEPQYRPLHPATLAAHPDLEDVMLEWRQL